MTLGGSAVLKVHPDSALQRVGGAFMAASAKDELHWFQEADGRVSEVAEFILESVDGRRTVEEFVALVCDEFEVERDVALADALKFLGLLVENQVLAV